MPLDEPFVSPPPRKKPEPPKEPGFAAKAGGFIIAVLMLFPVFLAGLAVAAVAFKFAWNTGLTGLVTACGGTISEIDYRTAFGAVVVLMFIRSITGADMKRKSSSPVNIFNTGGSVK